MNVKSFVPLIAGLCVGGLALKIGISTLQRAKGSQSAAVELWAATTDIPRGTQIGEDMLKPVHFPKDLVPGGAFTDKSKLVGRVPHMDAPAGLPILEPMLLPPGSPAGVHVPPGLRAVAVKVDEGSGVDFHLDPGSRVDVIGYFQILENNKRETIARTLIEDVEVAAVGARISAVANEGEGKSGGSRQARAVTLLVKPDSVPVLHLAEQRGKIKLSKRGSEDKTELGPGRAVSDYELLGETPESVANKKEEEKEEGGPLTNWLNKLFAQAPAAADTPVAAAPEPAPAPQPPANPPWVVQVYRGNQVETIQFQSRDSRERVPTQGELERVSAAGSKSNPAGAAAAGAMAAGSAPGKAACAVPAELRGENSSVNDESQTNAEDQVPQEPSE